MPHRKSHGRRAISKVLMKVKSQAGFLWITSVVIVGVWIGLLSGGGSGAHSRQESFLQRQTELANDRSRELVQIIQNLFDSLHSAALQFQNVRLLQGSAADPGSALLPAPLPSPLEEWVEFKGAVQAGGVSLQEIEFQVASKRVQESASRRGWPGWELVRTRAGVISQNQTKPVVLRVPSPLAERREWLALVWVTQSDRALGVLVDPRVLLKAAFESQSYGKTRSFLLSQEGKVLVASRSSYDGSELADTPYFIRTLGPVIKGLTPEGLRVTGRSHQSVSFAESSFDRVPVVSTWLPTGFGLGWLVEVPSDLSAPIADSRHPRHPILSKEFPVREFVVGIVLIFFSALIYRRWSALKGQKSLDSIAPKTDDQRFVSPPPPPPSPPSPQDAGVGQGEGEDDPRRALDLALARYSEPR